MSKYWDSGLPAGYAGEGVTRESDHLSRLVRIVIPKSEISADAGGGRYWVRTSDLFGVNEARYHCANRPRRPTIAERWRARHIESGSLRGDEEAWWSRNARSPGRRAAVPLW